jgi:Fe-S cluster assembly protein SufD
MTLLDSLPTPKSERWKYTNLPARLKKFERAPAKADIHFDGLNDFIMPYSDDNPAWVEEIAGRVPAGQDKYKDMMLWQAANDAPQDGYIINVPINYKAEIPLNMTITGRTGQHVTPRLIIRLGRGSELTLIEYQMGEGAYWNNAVMQIEIEDGAILNHYRFQENSSDAVVTVNTHVRVARSGHYNAFTLTNGASMSRNQIHTDLIGEGAACHLNGVNLLSGKQHADTTITVEHQAPHCESRQDYRSVLDGQSNGVFQGKVHVHQIAQKTDGYQLSNSLLLSQQATMNTKPELEIYADDVKCSHGTTSGMLDKNALFYLQTRGISENQARALLIQAFVSEVIEQIKNEQVQEQTALVVEKWLEAL